MDEVAVDKLYDALWDLIEGQHYETVMIVIGAVHNELAIGQARDEAHLRSLYAMMADAAVCMAMMDHDEGNTQLQASKNPSQRAKRAKKRPKTRDEPGPFGAH